MEPTIAQPHRTTTRPTQRRRGWRVAAGLLLLSAVPVAAGLVRLLELVGDAPRTAENARFVDAPVPVLVHVVGVSIFALLGAVQFVPALRRRSWHRRAGRVVAAAGVAAALSGLWMTLFYPRPPQDDWALEPIRFVVGVAMLAAIVLGVAAIRRRDVVRHRAWMMRAYALGLGAGTQVLTHLPWLLLVGTPTGTPRVLMMAAGWLINVAAVEWWLHRDDRG